MFDGTDSFRQVASTIPAQYFSKKRGIANGIVYAGGGLGGTAISFAMDGLIQKLGPPWTFRIIGVVTMATSLPAAWMIKERAPLTSTVFVEWCVTDLYLSCLDGSVNSSQEAFQKRPIRNSLPCWCNRHFSALRTTILPSSLFKFARTVSICRSWPGGWFQLLIGRRSSSLRIPC